MITHARKENLAYIGSAFGSSLKKLSQLLLWITSPSIAKAQRHEWNVVWNVVWNAM